MERSGFFNAVETDGNYDRVYDGNDFATLFSKFLKNGIFLDDAYSLKVIPKSGLTVTVKAGFAIINGYWYHLDEDMDITLDVNTSTSARDDTINLVLDTTTRQISLRVFKNVTNPSRGANDLCLAIVKVPVSSYISLLPVTDRRGLAVGAPYVEGIASIELMAKVEETMVKAENLASGFVTIVKNAQKSNNEINLGINLPSGWGSNNCVVVNIECLAKIDGTSDLYGWRRITTPYRLALDVLVLEGLIFQEDSQIRITLMKIQNKVDADVEDDDAVG